MPVAIAISPDSNAPLAAQHTLSPDQLGLLCDRAVGLSPLAIRELVARYVGTLEAVAILTAQLDTFDRILDQLEELERKYPAMTRTASHGIHTRDRGDDRRRAFR